MSDEADVPFHLRALDHLVLRVADLERSIGFYCDVIGCTVDRRRPEYDLVHLRAGASMIDLVLDDGRARAGDNVDHFCLQVTPFDETALLSHLAKWGVLIEPPIAQRYGAQGTGRSLYLRDPDGNRVELKEALQSA